VIFRTSPTVSSEWLAGTFEIMEPVFFELTMDMDAPESKAHDDDTHKNAISGRRDLPSHPCWALPPYLLTVEGCEGAIDGAHEDDACEIALWPLS